MALVSAALAALCPRPGAAAGDLLLATRDGPPVACHGLLLRARCEALPEGSSVESGEDSEVVFALLRWVYCEKVEAAGSECLLQDGGGVGPRAVRLGRRWGLRDADLLQSRVAGRRCIRRGSGTLAEDLLRAYDAGTLEDGVTFRASGSDEALPGGWTDALRQRSAYFAAMLGGGWAEARGGEIALHWPPEQVARLLRFLHGAPFVRGQGDLHAAVECAKFFEVPALFAEANEWIVAHLGVRNAPSLWNFLEAEPLLKHSYGVAQDDVADADGACFDFHVAHFWELTANGEPGDEEPEAFEAKAGALHELRVPLMHRLLSPGLLDLPSAVLTPVVIDYAKGKAKGEEYRELCEMLRPPAVLFNREHRSKLLPVAPVTVRSFLA